MARKRTLLEAIAGVRPRAGDVAIAAKEVPSGRPHAARRAGLGFVPADRARTGVFQGNSLTGNITAAGLRSYLRAGLVDPKLERVEAAKWVDTLRILPADTEGLIDNLSGGNQQKTVLGRWLARPPQVVGLLEPTQGVDVAARETIYEALRLAARTGGVLLGSSDAEELAQVCDRVIVMSRGTVAQELAGASMTAALVDSWAIVAPDESEAEAVSGG